MTESATAEQYVYRVRTAFPGSNTATTDLVRASSQQRAQWWAKEQYPRGAVERPMPVDPAGYDDTEIVDVGGWGDADV